MSADIGAAGSGNSSHLTDLPVGAEEATVVRTPRTGDDGAVDPADPAVSTFVARPAMPASVSPTLKRLFNTEVSCFGLRLAEFVIEERIGMGGMGAVFKAHDTRLSRKVALKVLSPGATLDEQAVSRFHNEARATARLSHDNIARVHSSGDDLGVHFIAYELIDGTNLRELIGARGTITTGETLNYALQIAMALNHTAACGVVHRDIKPSNIIITPEGRARVVDLGLARRDGDDSVADLTVAGSTLGTFDYISPEQAQDPRNVDVRSDIYSLGCTMFHMLTGQPPYPEGTALQKLLDHKGKDAPAPHEVNRRVPRDVSALVQRMMASEPGDRYASPALLVEDLMRIAARMRLKGIQPEGLVWKTSRETRPPFLQANLGWIVMGAILMLVAVFLRLKPQALETDYRFGKLPARVEGQAPPEPDAPAAAEPEIDRRGTDAFVAVVETLWPAEPWEIFPEVTNEREWPIASSLSGMVADLADSFRHSLKLRTDERAGSPNGADTTQRTMAGAGNGPLISLQSDPEKLFTTLEAACWAAKDGDVVVIRPGRDNVLVEKPLRVVKKNITILGEPVAGRVPRIQFDVGAEPSDTLSRMITVVGGDLRISNVDIEVVTREEIGTDRWVLCALEGADRVQLDKVNIDFRNAAALSAAVFEITLGADAALARMQNAAPGEFQIRLNSSFIRGDCRLFQVETALSGSIQLRQTAISLARPLLYVAGTNDTLLERDRIDVELVHSTCLLADGLVRMSTVDSLGGSGQQLLPVRIQSENSIFATAEKRPLVRMEGTSAPEEFRSRLTWLGTKNLYDGFDVFWQIDSSLAALGVYEEDFENWRNSWATTEDAGEVGAVSGSSPWAADVWRNQQPAATTVADLRLDETDADNPAIGAATDGSNLGVARGELREMPPRD